METARAIAKELDQQNVKRQQIESHILSQVVERLEKHPNLLKKRALVLDHHGWHQGVIGIVASRLVERYHRPAVVIAVADGIGKGSARSPHAFDLVEGLNACARHLEKFGGHKAAAGLTLKAKNIPAFRRDFESMVDQTTRPEDFVPELVIESEISAYDISAQLADQLEAVAPFGKGNPEPLFMLTDIDVLSTRMVGAQHLQMRLRPSNASKLDQAKPLDAIYFNHGGAAHQPGNPYRMACHVRWNRWQNKKRIQLVIKDWRGADG
jgi:single-stranded-DNA-specific exonuclease